MKTLICLEPGKFKYEDRPEPLLLQGNAIIKLKRIGICGTDLHAFEGTQPYFQYPRILGHELSGELVEVDNAPGFHSGEKVTFTPYFSCGRCIACRSGKTNCCVELKVCGVHIDGGMVEYLMVPSHTLVHGGDLGYDELALVEPLAIGAHGVERAAVKPGEFVLVIGAGPIGLGIMEFVRIKGGRVIAMDVNEERLKFCREKLLTDHIINPSVENALKKLKEITNGDMPEVVIDATGNLKAINNAFQYIAHGGRYLLIGLQKGHISFNHPEFHKREATLMSSRNATSKDFLHVIDSIDKGMISPLKYITHRVGFDKIGGSFANWLDPDYGVIKAMTSIE